MSLVIYVSHKTVIISKYNLEFRFTPPAENLTKAAIGAYQMLRQSEILQTESSRNEREEVITLLKHYGAALFRSVIPGHITSEIYKSGGLFVYSLDREIIDLPWELLYDGSSFFALTQGVVRINRSESGIIKETTSFMFPALRLSLSSYTPAELQPDSNRLIGYVEEFASAAVPRSPLVRYRTDGDASFDSILESLQWSPNLFYFSGYDTGEGWQLRKSDSSESPKEWQEKRFKEEVTDAIRRGLKIMLLQTSQLLSDKKTDENQLIKQLFDAGTPYVIAFYGRISRGRLKEYLNIFLLGLIREENILRAHRLAINHIQSSLPLSWDWSWIRFHINQKLLESTKDNPIPPFHFDRSETSHNDQPVPPSVNFRLLSSRRFQGNYEAFKRFNTILSAPDEKRIICLDASKGVPLEPYLHEYLRRTGTLREVSLNLFYYQKWGFSNKIKTKLFKSKYADLFSFLGEARHQTANLNNRLIPLGSTVETGETIELLIIFTPPQKKDPIFDRWLAEHQKKNRSILFVHDGTCHTSLKTLDFILDKTVKEQVINSFEDELPEEWIELIDQKLSPSMQDISLLKTIQKLGNRDLINYLHQSPKVDELYETSFHYVFSTLSASRLKTFLALYLLRIFCPKNFLIDLLEIKGIESDLEYLHHIHLINANLTFEEFWVPLHLQNRIRELSLIPINILETHGLDLLQNLITCLDRKNAHYALIEIGFHYVIAELGRNKLFEIPLQRNLQIGKKLSRKPFPEFRLTDNLITSLELALLIGKGQLIQKTLFTIVETLEVLPFGEETIAICEWLLQVEKKHRNWSLVSTIQTKAAAIYVRMNRKEKAIGLISSAIKLNNDINNFANRFQNLITIALLLLDLDEFDKLSKLLASAHFDMSLLSKDDIAKLWLIDGHLLYHNRKFREARTSFEKVLNEFDSIAQDSLMAKTYSLMADLSQKKNQKQDYAFYLEQTVRYTEACGDMNRAAELHQELYNLCVSGNRLEQAAQHLEWIYYFYQNSGNKTKIRDIADQLGGLYFKIGEQSKSTDFYGIAQGI